MEKKDFIEWARKLAVGYQGSPAVHQQLSNIDLIAIVGPTGVGKTTLIENLDLPLVIGDTTRAKREGEKDGEEYYFRTDYFAMLDEIKQGLYVQFLVAKNDEFYGTRASGYPASGPAAMAVIAREIPSFKSLGFRKIIPIYILPPSYVEWMHRIGTGRAIDISARMSEARESLPIALADPSYHLVLNDELELAVNEIKTVLNGGEISQHRKALAKESADLLFGRMGIDDTLLS